MKRIQARFTGQVGARILLKYTASQGGLAVLFVRNSGDLGKIVCCSFGMGCGGRGDNRCRSVEVTVAAVVVAHG